MRPDSTHGRALYRVAPAFASMPVLAKYSMRFLKRLGNFHGKPTGKMGVASSGIDEIGFVSIARVARLEALRRRDCRQCFNRTGNIRTGDSVVSMTSLVLNREQAAAHEFER